jgi:hypothetical protein
MDKGRVENISKKKLEIDGRIIYLVKWENLSEPSWEYAEDLGNDDDLVKHFEEKYGRTNKSEIDTSSPICSKKKLKIEKKVDSANSSILTNITRNVDLTNSLTQGDPDDDYDVKTNWDIDTPLCVKKLLNRPEDDRKYCIVEWNTRSDGTTPADDEVLYSIMKEKYPEILIDFFESRWLSNKLLLTK